MLLLAAPGCVRTATLQTARTIPAGETRIYGRGALAYASGPIVETRTPLGPATERDRAPLEAVQLEYEFGVDHGITDFLQISGGVFAPTPASGAGLHAGLKAQLVGDQKSPFGLAVLTDVTGVIWGHESVGTGGAYYVLDTELTVVASRVFSERWVVYGAPKGKWLSLWRNSFKPPSNGTQLKETTAGRAPVAGFGAGGGFLRPNGFGVLCELSGFVSPVFRTKAQGLMVSFGCGYQGPW